VLFQDTENNKTILNQSLSEDFMGDMQVSNSAMIKATPEAEKGIKKAAEAAGKHLSSLKDALFGKTGKAVLAGAASGALIGSLIPGGALPGAVVGGVVGFGAAASANAAEQNKKGLATLTAASTGILAAAAFGLPGLLVGGAAYAFATGAAQNAASKVGEFLQKNSQHMVATAAPQH
jgi:hypothetical protein